MEQNLPKISVITPSYNQGHFLEQTIVSVLGQQYPNLEFIIIDGGSTDNSVEIIKKYEQYVTYWITKKDNGQASAINEGFAKATGDVLCWLNSDDMYIPGALLKVGSFFINRLEPTILFGNCLHFHEENVKTRGSDVAQAHKTLCLNLCDYIIQPSTFWNRSVWEKVGILNEYLNYAFDWEWFLRAKANNIAFCPQKEYLSLYRIHDAHKSNNGSYERTSEIADLYEIYNNGIIKKAFLKWNKLKKHKLFNNIVYVLIKYNISLPLRLIHIVFFHKISYISYMNIIRM